MRWDLNLAEIQSGEGGGEVVGVVLDAFYFANFFEHFWTTHPRGEGSRWCLKVKV